MGQANLSDIVSNQSASPAASAPSTASGTARLSDIVPAQTPPATPPAPSLDAKVLEGAKQSVIGQAIEPPKSATEAVISTVGGPGALPVYRSAKGIVDSVENLVKHPTGMYESAAQDFKRAIDDFHKKDWRNLASDVVSSGADLAATTGVMPAGASQVRELSEGARPGGNLATPLTRDVLDAATIAATGRMGAAGEADTAAAGTGFRYNPFRAKVIQSNLQNGIRDVWNKVATTESVPAPQPGIGVGEIGEQVGDSILARSKAAYKQIDAATDGRFSGIEDKLRTVNKNLRFVTNDTEEQSLLIDKQRLEMQQDEMFDEAAKKGVSKDTVAAAKRDFKKAQAIYDTNAQIQASTTGVRPGMQGAADVPEEVNPKALMNRANKLYNKGRIQEGIGTSNAEDLIGHTATAQKAIKNMQAGRTALKVAAGVVGVPAAGTAVVEGVRKLME